MKPSPNLRALYKWRDRAEGRTDVAFTAYKEKPNDATRAAWNHALEELHKTDALIRRQREVDSQQRDITLCLTDEDGSVLGSEIYYTRTAPKVP